MEEIQQDNLLLLKKMHMIMAVGDETPAVEFAPGVRITRNQVRQCRVPWLWPWWAARRQRYGNLNNRVWCVFVQIPISDTFVSNTTNVRGVLHLPFFSLLLTMLADCGILLRLFPL